MGRYADPDSRRSRAAAARQARLDATALPQEPAASPRLSSVPNTGGALPQCPAWAAESVKAIFASIVGDLVSAKVPLKRIDGHAVLMMAQCVDGVREATAIGEDPEAESNIRIMALKLKQQYARDLIQWIPLLAACPIGRARLGQKPEPEKKGGALAELLARRQTRQA